MTHEADKGDVAFFPYVVVRVYTEIVTVILPVSKHRRSGSSTLGDFN